jgi:hypothetical protein
MPGNKPYNEELRYATNGPETKHHDIWQRRLMSGNSDEYVTGLKYDQNPKCPTRTETATP